MILDLKLTQPPNLGHPPINPYFSPFKSISERLTHMHFTMKIRIWAPRIWVSHGRCPVIWICFELSNLIPVHGRIQNCENSVRADDRIRRVKNHESESNLGKMFQSDICYDSMGHYFMQKCLQRVHSRAVNKLKLCNIMMKS